MGPEIVAESTGARYTIGQYANYLAGMALWCADRRMFEKAGTYRRAWEEVDRLDLERMRGAAGLYRKAAA
jgi:hypothetical protein